MYVNIESILKQYTFIRQCFTCTFFIYFIVHALEQAKATGSTIDNPEDLIASIAEKVQQRQKMKLQNQPKTTPKLQVCMCTCMYACMCTCMYSCTMYVCMYTCVCMYMYVYACMYVY